LKFSPKWHLALAISFGLLSFATPHAGRDVITEIIWPPAGIGLAAFLLIGSWAILPIAIPAFLLSGHFPTEIPAAAATAAASVVEAALGAYLLRKILEPGLLLRRLRGVIAFFFLGATLSTLVAGTGSEVIHTLLGLHHWSELPTRIYQWGRADFLGILIVTPLILAWSQKIDWRLNWGRQRRYCYSPGWWWSVSVPS